MLCRKIGLTRTLTLVLGSLTRPKSTTKATYRQAAHLQLDMGKKRKLDAEEQRNGFFCPACNQMALKWPVFSRHLQRCCPDLLIGKSQLCDESLQPAVVTGHDVTEALKQAIAEEEEFRRQCVSTQNSLCRANLPERTQNYCCSETYRLPMGCRSS